MTTKSLSGRRLLIVEDDYYQAQDLLMCLTDAGAQIVAIAGDVLAVEDFLDGQQIDLALLDINLGNKSSFEVARILSGNKIPVMFLTGYQRDILPADLVGIPLLSKPYNESYLVKKLSDMFEASDL